MGTQDLGTGTRTVILMVAADTLGIPMSNINLLIGDTRYPVDPALPAAAPPSGGVSASTRRAAVDALNQLFEKVAPASERAGGRPGVGEGRHSRERQAGAASPGSRPAPSWARIR